MLTKMFTLADGSVISARHLGTCSMDWVSEELGYDVDIGLSGYFYLTIEETGEERLFELRPEEKIVTNTGRIGGNWRCVG